MYISVKAFLNEGLDRKVKLIRQFETEYPYVLRNKYLANARAMSPEITGKLKGSNRSQIMGNKLTIVWKAPYAAAVNAGGHTDKTTHFAPAKRFGRNGKGYMATAGTFHPYRTGSKGFVNRIGVKTFNDMEEYIRSKLA